jgi:DNA polymerase-3 subunit delta
MKPEELSAAITSGQLGPLYYLHGEEGYLMDRVVREAIERLVLPDFKDFNLNIFYGNECRGEEIVETALTLPFFTDRRVIVVKRGDDLSVNALGILSQYLANPSPSTCLIIQGGKIDQRKKFFTDLKKVGELVEFKRLYENQLAPFIRSEVAAHGKKIDGAGVDLLVYLVGNNLQELSSQIEKAAAYVGGQANITVQDVRAIVSATRVRSVFDLTNAVGEKDLASALRVLENLYGEGEAPLLILAMLTRHFRQLWQVRELLDRKTSNTEIGKKAGINPYFLNGIIEQSRNFTVPELRGVFRRMFETDLALKSGGKEVVLSQFIVGLCSR